MFDNKVENVILAEDKETAENITGKLCIEIPEDSLIGIDWTLENDTFVTFEKHIFEELTSEIIEGDISNEETQ